MPTIKQLPLATFVDPTDELPLSQGGQTRSVSVEMLLASTQPLVTLAPAKLLGRVSPSVGGPEPVNVGAGLEMTGDALNATGADHAGFPMAAGLSTGDEALLNAGGQPRRMAATALRGLFTAGTGVSVQNGVISAIGGGTGGTVGATGPEGPAGPEGPLGPQGPKGDPGSGTIPTDNAQLFNSRGYVTLPQAQAVAAGVLMVSGFPNGGGALGTHLDITNPGVPFPTEITYGARITYVNPNVGQTTYDFGQAVQCIWQKEPGQNGGQMFGQWTIAASPREATRNWGLVGYEINPVNRGDDTGWSAHRGMVPRFSAALQLVPETNTFTHGGTATNITAGLVIAQSPFPRADGFYARTHSGVLVEPNAISGGVGRAFTLTGDITGAGQNANTPYAVMTLLGGWARGLDFTGATVFDGAALRMSASQRLAWGGGASAAQVGANGAGDVLLLPATGGTARVGASAVWHAGNLQIGTGLQLASGVLSATATAGPTGPQGPTGATGATGATGPADAGAAQRASNLSDLASPGLSRANINHGVVALTPGASIATNCALGNAFTLTLGANATLASPSGLQAGASYCWTIAQDAAGGRTLGYGGAFKFPGGTVPALSTAANATDVLTAVSNGTVLFCVLSKGFA